MGLMRNLAESVGDKRGFGKNQSQLDRESVGDISDKVYYYVGYYDGNQPVALGERFYSFTSADDFMRKKGLDKKYGQIFPLNTGDLHTAKNKVIQLLRQHSPHPSPNRASVMDNESEDE